MKRLESTALCHLTLGLALTSQEAIIRRSCGRLLLPANPVKMQEAAELGNENIDGVILQPINARMVGSSLAIHNV